MSLRARLAVAAVVVVAVLALAGVALVRTVRASQVDDVDRSLSASMPAALGLAGGFGFVPTSDAPTPDVPRLSDVYVARVSGEERTVLVRPSAPSGEPTLPDVAIAVPQGLRSPVTVGSQSGPGRWRALLVETRAGSRVLVAASLDGVDATLRRVTVAVVVVEAATLLTIALAGWWVWRLGLRPLADVATVADAISAGERSRRVGEARQGTEAGRLARAFNVMLDEQQATEDRLRQFVADASHELRTPVAAIAGFADLWRQGPFAGAGPGEGRGPPGSDAGEMMRRIGQESARMRELVEDLLLLAHLDEGRPITRAKVDLTEVARDAVLDSGATHPSRNVALDAPAPAVVDGDEGQLRQVVSNLVTNALVHTPAGTAVRIATERSAAMVVLRVSDDGPGMTAGEAERAFDRFWRADPARHRGGSGLGLAIVRGIVEAHGGAITLASVPGEGTTVRVELPGARAEQRTAT